jgi:hypothetical protein
MFFSALCLMNFRINDKGEFAPCHHSHHVGLQIPLSFSN